MRQLNLNATTGYEAVFFSLVEPVNASDRRCVHNINLDYGN